MSWASASASNHVPVGWAWAVNKGRDGDRVKAAVLTGACTLSRSAILTGRYAIR
jgi:hypothetical protein